MHKNKKKGFTLIEMMVVIAIIAILVTMIVPAVKGYRTRAAAATNAANLRSVEGQLSTLLVTNPEVLRNSLGQDFSEAVTTIYNSISIILGQTPNWRVQIALADAMLHLGDRLAENVFYGHDGEMRLNNMTIAAPTAKALSVDGITIYNKTEMEVVVGDGYIVATYAGMTADAFAAIAEEGEEGDYATTAHKYVDTNGDHVCDICKGEYSHTADEMADGIIDGVISGGHTCRDNDKDHVCDDCGNTVGTHKTDVNKNNGTHGCDYCSYAVSCVDSNMDHKCDTCGYSSMGTHNYYNNNNADTHICDYCGTEEHKFGLLGLSNTCSTCGYEKESCITPDTLVTLANGGTKAVKDLNYTDQIIAWNHFTGGYQVTSASYIVRHDEKEVNVITLHFADGTSVEIVGEHGFFDLYENQYVFISEKNVASYIGHGFAKQSYNGHAMVTLVGYTVESRFTASYSLASIACNNVMANGMFSLTPIEGMDSEHFFNFIKMGRSMKYDEAALAKDVATYGLFTAEDFAGIMTEAEFAGFKASNGHYLKIAVEKGYCTFEEILAFLNPTDMVGK